MDADYHLVNFIELGYLTPLEKVVVTTHNGFKAWAERTFAAETTLRAHEVADMALVAFEKSSPEYRYAAACAAAADTEDYLHQMTIKLAITLSSHLNMPMDTTGLVYRLDVGPPQMDEIVGMGLLSEMVTALNGREPTQEELEAATDFIGFARKERFMAQFQLVTEILDAGAPEQFIHRTEQEVRIAAAALLPVAEETQYDDTFREATRFTEARKAAKRPSKGFLERAELKLRKQGKRALRRAYNFFMDHEREEELRVFIRGGDVEVSHEESDVKFIFKRGQGMDLIERSIEDKSRSGQWRNIDVEIFTKTNVFLAGVCVYIKDTPILDQLMGLIMMVEAGLEEDLIKLGNLKHFNREVVFEDLALKSSLLLDKLTDLKARHAGLRGNLTTTTLITNYTRFVETTSTYVNSWVRIDPGTTIVGTYSSAFDANVTTNIGLISTGYQNLVDQATLYHTQPQLEIA